MKRKIIVREVEADVTNADIRRLHHQRSIPVGLDKDGNEIYGRDVQVTVNDVTTPKAAKKKARGNR